MKGLNEEGEIFLRSKSAEMENEKTVLRKLEYFSGLVSAGGWSKIG